MQHADPERLALIALGEPAADDETTVHLGRCARCRAEVESLRRTADLARETVDLRDPVTPPEAVWARIAADLDLGGSVVDGSALTGPAGPVIDSPAASTGASAPAGVDLPASPDGTAGSFGPPDDFGGSVPVPGPRDPRTLGGRHRTGGPGRAGGVRRGRRVAAVVSGLVAAVAVGVVGTLVAVRPWDGGAAEVAGASAQLGPVAGGPGGVSGRVAVVRRGSGSELDVTATGLPAGSGYYEVWVFDGKDAMVSVGVLGGDSAAELPLPPTLDLRRFRVVDISQERYDGDQTHSTLSVLRGTLTG
jgi:hypothetical protein